jgi:O-acetyl-ADP-ribose deacetylase (regulator of RNase III)
MPAAIEILVGRIETLALDAIVNPANRWLTPGGGADGAIRRAAGPELDQLLARAGGLSEGEALRTPGFGLPARFVIHTVAPIYTDPSRDEAARAALLASCYAACLRAAADLASIAFPSIGTGAYGWPIETACRIALAEIAAAAMTQRVVVCCFSEADADVYRAAAAAR